MRCSPSPSRRGAAGAALLSLLLSAFASANGGNVIAATARDAAVVTVPSAAMLSDASSDPGLRARVRDAIARLPISFEENRGQFDGRVRYLARGNGFTLSLGEREAALGLRSEDGKRDAVAMRFIGATPSRIQGLGTRPGVSNYISADDRAAWQTNVPSYEQVRYTEIYPGIDLVFYGLGGALEYDFVVAPGADASAIRLAFDHARGVRVDAEGDLVLSTEAGEIRQHRPVLYQETAGGRVAVVGDFVVAGREAWFRVGAYDPSLPLVIDPVVTFSTLIGGDGQEEVEDLAVDGSGNVYICGSTSSDDYPLLNPIQSNRQGNTDAFVTKLNAQGSAMIYSTYFVSDDIDFANAIDVDASGRAAVVGRANYSGWPLKNQYARHGLFYDPDCTIAVLNAAGNDLVYGTYFGGRDVDEAFGVAWDLHGNLFVVGKTESNNFPTKSPSNLAPKQENLGGAFDAFVAKFDPDVSGNGSLVYSTYLGGGGTEIALAVDVDDFERAYVTGVTGSFNFPTTSAIQNAQGGVNDAFVTKYNADGTAVFYSTFHGGNGPDQGNGIVAAPDGSSVVVVGQTDSTNLSVQNAFQPNAGDGVPNDGKKDMFALKLDAEGDQRVFSTYLGGPLNDFATDAALDARGNVYAAGFAAVNFPFIDPVEVNGSTATTGALIVKMTAAGIVTLATAIDTNASQGRGIAVDEGGDVYFAGTTVSNTFPTVGTPFQPLKNAFGDGFVMKLDLTVDDTIGRFTRTGTPTFTLSNSNTAPAADIVAAFGVGGDVPVTGDFNNDGIQTFGIYKPATGQFQLRNTNSAGAPDNTFVFGAGNQVPIVGDWDGNGRDTVGVYDPATSAFFLRNANNAGAADITLVFGAPGQGLVPIVGDWDGDGVDTVGVFKPSTREFFLRNSNTNGNADLTFAFGPTTLPRPLAGDWDGDGVDTIGVASRSILGGLVFNLRNDNSAGPADFVKTFGAFSSDVPIVGNWDGQ
jgi:hypothetical protein